MAKNVIFEPGLDLSVICSNPTTPASGDPVRYGNLTGVARTNEDAAGYTSVAFGQYVADLSVKGIDDSAPAAVAVGDAIWYVDADTPKLSKKASGYFFGIALEAVGSGQTATIQVQHIPSPGTGTLASGSIGTTQLAANGVTAAKLTATMATGYIPLPLAEAREVAANVTQNLAAHGGILASDSTPILQRVNGATDKQLRINWASSNSDEITWSIMSPPDLDDAAAVTVKIMAAMAGATDTPVVAVGFFEGTGDTNAGGNSGAVTGTTPAVYSVAIAHGDIAAAPKAWSISLVPAAHTTDALYVYGAWIEYTRK